MLATVLVMRGENFLHWNNFKSGLDDYGAPIDIYRQLIASNPTNTTARIRMLICRIAVAHTKLKTATGRAVDELEDALTDLNPLLSDPSVNDDTLYAAAVGYADLAKVGFTAAHNPVAAANKSHWESAARWYGLSASTLKRVRNLASASESEAFGPIDPAGVSKQLAIWESALGHSTHSMTTR
jgi:hypothetical protein